ncbi:MAG: DUF3160 domain-containing protein [Planctomycetes bacterium]|nr:DUF3160 domain-containing protein [Planctomycetota bacterium]
MTLSLHRAACWVALLATALPWAFLRAGDEGPAGQLPPGDLAFLEDYREALRGFKGLSVDQFLEAYGPKKAYSLGGTSSFVRGDASGDGGLNITDAICMLSRLFDGAGACGGQGCLDAGDSNDDGLADISDPIYLLAYLFLGGPAPPAPFPDAGDDPTADALECPGSPLGYDPFSAERLAAVLEAYPLGGDQRTSLESHGFVIAKDRRFATFFQGFKDAFVRHLPVYISADAMLDALHLSFDRILMDVEENLLVAELDQLLRKLDDRIAALGAYAGGADMSPELDDVASWVCTARSLLAGSRATCRRGVEARVAELLGHVASETIQTVELFGVTVDEDFSQFRPRGHYTRTEALRRYFRAMMWVQRIGMRFAESPRHALVAFLLTRGLLDSGALAHWDRVNAVVEAMVGTSDSLNPRGLAALSSEAAMDTGADFRDGAAYAAFVDLALRTGAGRQLINSMLLWSDPTYEDGFTPIPPAFHVLGQRFIVDSFVFTNVVFDRVRDPDRWMPSPLDVWLVLGNRAATPLLEPEIRLYEHHPNLAALDWIVSRYPASFWSSNLYNLWLSALQALHADTTSERYPPAMRTVQWDRRMLHAQLASWAHLRHDTILYAKPSYSGIECDYPDGWVDPYPDFFEKLARYAEGAIPKLDAAGLLDTELGTKIVSYLELLRDHSRALADIARSELAGLALTSDQMGFIRSLVVDEGVCGPDFAGWYMDLIYDCDDDNAEIFDPTIADVHTDPMAGEVLHVGVGHPSLMVMTVKNECGVRAYAGPVLSYHELVEGGLHRMTDEEWKARLESGADAPRPGWTADFVR